VENEQPKVGGALKAVMALAGAGPAMTGWVGAQSLLAPRGAGEEREECVIEPGSEEMFAAVAAGSEEKLFVLANEFVAEVEGERTYSGPPFPAVIEFGPGGGGCPKAVPRGLEGEVNGELLGERSIAPGEAVTFSSYVRQADAVEVEWDFGDGTRETVTGQFHCRKGVVPEEDSLYEANVRQCPTARHTFTSGGALTVTETIHTDDLATPVVMQQTIIHVLGEALGPTAVATGPLQAVRGQEARFDGSASYDPAGPNQITEYHWSFGDGQSQTSSSPIASHVYQQVGFYPVSLTVTDASGRTSSAATLPLPVAVVEPPPPGEPIQT